MMTMEDRSQSKVNLIKESALQIVGVFLHIVNQNMVKRIIILAVSILLAAFTFVLDNSAAKYGRSRQYFQYDLKYGLQLTNINGFYISDPWEGASYLYPDTYYRLGNGDSVKVHKIFGYKVGQESIVVQIQKGDNQSTYLKFNSEQSVENHIPEVIKTSNSYGDWVNVANPPFLFYYSQLIVLVVASISIITFILGVGLMFRHFRRDSKK